ncbi:Integral membrane protein [Lactococcus cremoris]|nr:Integral membrane protein [Lactococcus cremoris]
MRKLLKFSGGILASFLLLCLICLGLILSKVNTSVAKDHKIDTILVLGSKVEANKKPSHIMQERLEAARLLAQKILKRQLLSREQKGLTNQSVRQLA